MNIILNETAYAEQILSQIRLSKKPSYDLRILSKYFCHTKGYKPEQIYQKLVQIMEDKYEHFAITSWQTMLLDMAKQAKKFPPVQLKEVPVTRREMSVIDALESKPMRRLAFTFVCLARYRNLVNPSNNGWLNYDYKDIFKMANITITKKEQCRMIHDMEELGLIGMSKVVDNLSLHILFLDQDTQNTLLSIHDFRNLGYEYLLHHGEPYLRCQVCGILIRRRNNRTKYCTLCAEETDRQKSQIRMEQARKYRTFVL